MTPLKQALAETLINFSVNNNDYITGYVDSSDELNSLILQLENIGYSFSVRDTDNISNGKFHFKCKMSGIDITCDGVVFCIESTTYKQCSLGPKYYKKKETTVPNHLAEHVNPKKKRFYVKDTKKSGCPAIFIVKCLRLYPDFSIQSDCDNWRQKKKVIDILKQAINSGESVKSFLRWYIIISGEQQHTHAPTAAMCTQRVHPEIISEIHRLVGAGVSSVRDLKMLLGRFVENLFGANEKQPLEFNTAFYPSNEVIYSHMYRATYALRKSVMDQEALAQQCDKWQASPETKCHFRPYKEDENGVTPLMFCYQSKWQRELMKKYGIISLLDATYKTTRYALPLFFITVKTNVGYLVAGVFVVQNETACLIEEALTVFKAWNAEWQPIYWMTDFCEAEILAIERTFPGSTVYICAFHREQAWLRWIKKAGNLDVPADAEGILKAWRKIAESPTLEAFNAAVSEMNSSPLFSRNKKALSYITSHWLHVRHRWVEAFNEKGRIININTNNGVEAMNKMLKHTYLKFTSDKTLTGMLIVVVTKYLPDAFKKYCRSNSSVKMYNEELPSFLHGKSPNFISHVMKRFAAAKEEISDSNVAKIDDGLFHVQSCASEQNYYIVNFDNADCTCADFRKWRFPCKHMCAVFIHHRDWSFEKLNPIYVNNPFIILDADFGYGSDMNSVDENVPSLPENESVSQTPSHTLQDKRCLQELQRMRENAKHLINMTYLCEDKADLLSTVLASSNFLNEAVKAMQECLPLSEGLPLENNNQNISQDLPRKRKRKGILTTTCA